MVGKLLDQLLFKLFVSEDDTTLLIKCNEDTVTEIEFIESGLSVRYSARPITINTEDKIIIFK
ncbi:hypothetical protein CUU60_03905 [Paenibacillus polymyxa ATCC 842]|nr:hypothetical protein [Paenibacillus polymyxa]UOD84384.1 hypothetical protein CUU60_03905 [Paenibacillus polymyxa ATCC 842]